MHGAPPGLQSCLFSTSSKPAFKSPIARLKLKQASAVAPLGSLSTAIVPAASPAMATLDPLAVLPIEVVLHLCTYCSLSTLSSLHLVSPTWHSFLESHSHILYRFRAYDLLAPACEARNSGHGERKHPLQGEEGLEALIAGKQSPRTGYWDVSGWKEFCACPALAPCSY